MNKIIVAAIIVLMLFSLTLGIFDVRATYTVGAVMETPGVVNCLIEFDCDSGYEADTYKIYYGEHSSITIVDNETYEYGGAKDDGDVTYEITYWGNEHRYHLIAPLTESTTYYYRIWNVDEGDWAEEESSFTTLDRFTTEWKDEFFDDYLWEANDSVYLELQQGRVRGPLTDLDDVWGYMECSVFYDGEYRFYGIHEEPSGAFPGALCNQLNYSYSADGINWSTPAQISLTGTDGSAWTCGSVVNDSGTYKYFYRTNAMLASATSTSLTGPFTTIEFPGAYNPMLQKLSMSTTLNTPPWSYDEFGMLSFTNDTLGANKWIATGQAEIEYCSLGGRIQGLWFGINDTIWMIRDEASDGSMHEAGAPTAGKFFMDRNAGGIAQAVHSSPNFIKSGIYIFFIDLWNETTCTGSNDDKIRPFLAVSRNGYTDIEYFNNTPSSLMRLSDSYGDWDYGMVRMHNKPFITVGDYDYLYYTQYEDNHEHTNSNEKYGSQARLEYRKDGITNIAPQSSGGWFRTTTIPSAFARNLTINGNFSSDATLNISVINANTSTVFYGFDHADCDFFNTNSTTLYPTWENGARDIDNIEGHFQLNFSFTGTGSELFSYTLDRLGESGGDGGEGVPSNDTQFIAINGFGNGSTIQDATPTFNWTITSGAFHYRLQVATDIGFSSLVVDLDNISSINTFYSGYYEQNTTRIAFTLPLQFALDEGYIYYTRVRAFSL